MSNTNIFKVKPLELNSVSGNLDAESCGIVAADIVLRMIDNWPDNMPAIVASWDKIAETVRLYALPMLAPPEGDAHG